MSYIALAGVTVNHPTFLFVQNFLHNLPINLILYYLVFGVIIFSPKLTLWHTLYQAWCLVLDVYFLIISFLFLFPGLGSQDLQEEQFGDS